MTTLKQLGEREVIRRLTANLSSRPDVVLGAGDDTAIVRTGDPAFDLLLTSDAVIEGTHFTSGSEPRRIGHKAIARALSDIAAMGGEPLHVVIDLVATEHTKIETLEKIYEGATDLAQRHGVAIVGGDTAQGPKLELHVFATGRVPRGTALLRSGAKTDDVIYVTGVLGGSRQGRHLTFEPRIVEGKWLREEGWANALIDISDGLATDLRHVAARSGVGAIVDEAKIPVSSEAASMNDARSPVEHALFDGEDFELLFTVSAAKASAFESAWAGAHQLPCTRIGSITNRVGEILLRDARGRERPLMASGFEHFR